MKVTVNYNKDWSDSGTVYEQTVTVPKSMKRDLNGYLSSARTRLYEGRDFNHIYLDNVHEDVNYTTLTTMRAVTDFLRLNKVDVSRILTDRNTKVCFK